MPELTRLEPAVPCFESVAALREGLDAKAQFAAEDLYPRDGSLLLGEIESKIAQLAGVSEAEILAYTSGMSAVTDAIDVALRTAEAPTPTLAYGRETYTQTRRYIESFLRGKDVDVVYFDSGDTDSVRGLVEQRHPDVIVAETIANYVNVPVLDTAFLLERVRAQEHKPTVVLDNTLPLSTALPLGESLTADDSVIVVESGTKSYTFNTELFGVGYTKNPALLDWLLRYRRTRGTLPAVQSLEFISQIIPDSREAFDERNQKLFRNTGDIALRLAAGLGANKNFTISHPGQPSHDNHDFYSRQYPGHATPLFYIQSNVFDQYEVAEYLWAHPGVRDQARLGQSFGFDHTRIVADENVGAVRIAGGADTDGQTLGDACAEALQGAKPLTIR